MVTIIQINKKYYCDICQKEITQDRMKKSNFIEKNLFGLDKYHLFGSWEEDNIMCNICLFSLKQWYKERSKK